MNLLLTSLVFLFGPHAWSVEIPKRLTESDRSVVIRTLGLNSSTKILSNPYPLGGYSGLELGVSLELIDTKELSRLGCEPGVGSCPNTSRSDEKEFAYPRFTIGKGLYNDLDIFLSFALPTPGVELSDFGGQIRWNFFETEFLPIVISGVLQGNQMNINNSFTTQNVSLALIAGVTVDDFSIYFGGGYIRSESQFTCGDQEDGVIDSFDPACQASNSGYINQVEHGSHSLVGINLMFNEIFLAAQIDRYRDPVFSAKLGLRF
ncbi:MAG: hypothetical protein KDD45_09480 [Bdellovibrionales bacterium]|nr:hypothetical protein [Bdellovibrionales bacterium]